MPDQDTQVPAQTVIAFYQRRLADVEYQLVVAQSQVHELSKLVQQMSEQREIELALGDADLESFVIPSEPLSSEVIHTLPLPVADDDKKV